MTKNKKQLTQSDTSFFLSNDDFQKSHRNAIFENCVKNLSFEKIIKCLMVFFSDS